MGRLPGTVVDRGTTVSAAERYRDLARRFAGPQD